MIYIFNQRVRCVILAVVGMAYAIPAMAQDYDKAQNVQEIVVVGNNPQNDNLLLPQVGVKSFSAEVSSRCPLCLESPMC